MNDIRAQILAAAPTVVGLDADRADPDRRQRYLDLIAPGETPIVAADLATRAGCGLVVAGLWRAAGVEDPQLDAPYRIGSALTRLKSIADSVGAWIPFAAGSFPDPGDMVLVRDTGAVDVEHVFTVTAITVDEQGAAQIQSVDGGQRDAKGFETILALSRSWRGSIDTVTGHASRLIVGWIDTSLLPSSSAPARVATGSLDSPVTRSSAVFSQAARGAPGVDSEARVTQADVDLATQSFKTAPVFWGRYFSTPTTGGPVEYNPVAENAILHAAGIFVLPIARQTAAVGGSERQGESDGRVNAAALIAAFGLSYLVSQGGEFLMFLDVEPEHPLSADYYQGWCKGLASIAPAITIHPCVYTNQANEKTWIALNVAAAAGTPCHGLWVAHYIVQGVFEPLGDWSVKDTAPSPPVAAPVLIWQYVGDAFKGRFDCDQVSPTLDLEKDLLRYLILPPA